MIGNPNTNRSAKYIGRGASACPRGYPRRDRQIAPRDQIRSRWLVHAQPNALAAPSRCVEIDGRTLAYRTIGPYLSVNVK